MNSDYLKQKLKVGNKSFFDKGKSHAYLLFPGVRTTNQISMLLHRLLRFNVYDCKIRDAELTDGTGMYYTTSPNAQSTFHTLFFDIQAPYRAYFSLGKGK